MTRGQTSMAELFSPQSKSDQISQRFVKETINKTLKSKINAGKHTLTTDTLAKYERLELETHYEMLVEKN